MEGKVGFAWVFENVVAFGSVSDLHSLIGKGRKRKKFGSFLGVVKGLIPVDPYHVIYFYHRHTKAFLERQKLRKFRRKLGITRKELRYLRPLTKWQKRARGTEKA